MPHCQPHHKTYLWQPPETPSTFLPTINPLNPELNFICYLLELLAHHFLHVSRIRVKSLTLRLLMSYIYGAPILDVSRSHTTTQHSQEDSSGRVISSSQRPLPDNTRHSQQTNIHALGGIRTHELSRWAAAGRSPAEFPDISLIFPWYFPDISLSFLSLLSLVLSNPSFLFSWFIIHHLWSASLRAVSLPAVKNCTNSCPIMTPHWRHSRRQWPVCRNCLATKDTFKPSL